MKKLRARLALVLSVLALAICAVIVAPRQALAADPFTDVDSETPHYEDIVWMRDEGISKGFEDGTFRPYDPIARCDMAAFLHRMRDKGFDIAVGDIPDEWAQRIDAFNEGTPLAGYGAVFAEAASAYGVDPRIAPAIARLESSSGAYCFLPYNAWGWGSVSWPDWETAIWGFTRGYSEGYGGDVTMEGAQRYCPGNAELWYEIVTNYMDQI